VPFFEKEARKAGNMRRFFIKAGVLAGALALIMPVCLPVAAQAQRAPLITFYTGSDEDGSAWHFDRSISDTMGYDGAGPVRSVVILEGTWRLCKEVNYTGYCVTLGPGAYSDFDRTQFADRIVSVQLIRSGSYVYRDSGNYYRDANGNYVRVPYGVGGDAYDDGPPLARVTLFAGVNFGGRSIDFNGTMRNLFDNNFNDVAQSLIIRSGRWQLCEDADFGGQCLVLGRGEYPDLGNQGMTNTISSVRPI
jgi:hypothetical protein